MRTNWESFYVEIIMIIGIVVFFLNFFTGKSKNQKMANQLIKAHSSTLESQFSLWETMGRRTWRTSRNL